MSFSSLPTFRLAYFGRNDFYLQTSSLAFMPKNLCRPDLKNGPCDAIDGKKSCHSSKDLLAHRLLIREASYRASRYAMRLGKVIMSRTD
jgi:hypothetical protein